MWFDKRAMPRAYKNEGILIFLNIIDLLQLYIMSQNRTADASDGQANTN